MNKQLKYRKKFVFECRITLVFSIQRTEEFERKRIQFSIGYSPEHEGWLIAMNPMPKIVILHLFQLNIEKYSTFYR